MVFFEKHGKLIFFCVCFEEDRNKLSVYISNRVQKIQNSGVRIFFVPGALNPTDLISKPEPSRDYVNNPFWLHGPNYLRLLNHSWMQEYSLDYITKNQTLSDTQNNDYYKELKQKDTLQVFLAQSKHSKTESTL